MTVNLEASTECSTRASAGGGIYVISAITGTSFLPDFEFCTIVVIVAAARCHNNQVENIYIE